MEEEFGVARREIGGTGKKEKGTGGFKDIRRKGGEKSMGGSKLESVRKVCNK